MIYITKAALFYKKPIYKRHHHSFWNLTPVGLSKINLNPTKIFTSARVCPLRIPLRICPRRIHILHFYTALKLIAILTKPIPTGWLMRIWLGLLLKIMVWTKSYIPQNCTISQNNQIHESNYDSFQGLTPVVPSCPTEFAVFCKCLDKAL